VSNPLVVSLRARPALWFALLAFLLSWYPTLLGELGVKASGINPLGPFVAALILSGAIGGWAAVKALLGRMVRIRIRFTWYLAAVLLAPALAFAALGIGLLFGIKAPAADAWTHWPDLAPTFVIMFLFFGLGEEPGWRGFLLPTLQKSQSALTSALIVGVVWAVWHAPFYGNQVPWEQVLPFFLNVIAGSVVIAWIFNNARGSVFLTMLMHAVTNTIGGAYVAQLLRGDDLTRWWWIFTALWMLTAALIAWRTGPALTARAVARPSAREIAVPA